MAKVGSSLLRNFSRKATRARSAALAECPVFTVPLTVRGSMDWRGRDLENGARDSPISSWLETWKSLYLHFTEVTEMARLIVLMFSFQHSVGTGETTGLPSQESGEGPRPSSAWGSPCPGFGPRLRACVLVTSSCVGGLRPFSFVNISLRPVLLLLWLQNPHGFVCIYI